MEEVQVVSTTVDYRVAIVVSAQHPVCAFESKPYDKYEKIRHINL